MPINNATRPTQITDRDDDQTMSRTGGAASKAMPVIKSDLGQRWAGMEATLLKGAAADPKSMAGGGSGRQFFTKAAGGDLGKGRVGSAKKIRRITLK